MHTYRCDGCVLIAVSLSCGDVFKSNVDKQVSISCGQVRHNRCRITRHTFNPVQHAVNNLNEISVCSNFVLFLLC